jgi:peptide/nickel transport system permease protein
MLNEGVEFLLLPQAKWLTIFPGISIMLVVLGFNFLGDGLRDAMDPRLRGAVDKI